MTQMTPDLYKSILAMDSYNRGYGATIKFGALPDNSDSELVNTQVGNALIYQTSNRAASIPIGFYAIAYSLNGDTIISFRGTDQPPNPEYAIGLADLALLFTFPGFCAVDITVKLADNTVNSITPDTWNGWFVGAGSETSAQALLAFEFYKDVVGGLANVYSANVTLTGHSLGGGLAGLVVANDNYQLIKSKVA